MFHDKYPGNDFVFKKMCERIAETDVVAVTGAGTSAPAVPTWGSLLNRLLTSATQEGMIDKNLQESLSEESDYLYVADELYRAMAAQTVRTRVCQIAGSLSSPTAAHELLVQIPFAKYVTLNYDTGLELAFTKLKSEHVLSITPKNETELYKWNRSRQSRSHLLHWHGIHSSAQDIVFSASDYHAFYVKSPQNTDALKNIFKNQTAFFVGFGFGDPFFERQLNITMYDAPTENTHFAIVGVADTDNIDVARERRKYATKYKCETLFYPVLPTPSGQNHDGLSEALKALHDATRSNSAAPNLVSTSSTTTRSNATDPGSNQNLFVFGDKQIYCKPNLWIKRAGAELGMLEKVSVEDVVASSNHAAIHAPREYGLTTLGRQILSGVLKSGGEAVLRDAENIANYRKKLLQDVELVDLAKSANPVLLIDRFSPVDQSRMIKELTSVFPNIRIIILIASSFHGADTENEISEITFDQYKLEAFSRSNIREVVNIISDSIDVDFISSIVEKIYDDLLQLCIPLTPSNVIIYASVLCKDGTFSPVSRLHIIDRFVTEALAGC